MAEMLDGGNYDAQYSNYESSNPAAKGASIGMSEEDEDSDENYCYCCDNDLDDCDCDETCVDDIHHAMTPIIEEPSPA